MSTVKKPKLHLIGRREFIDFPGLQFNGVEGKVDTGAYTSSLHVETLDVANEDGQDVLYFTIEEGAHRTFRFTDFSTKKIKNSFGEMEERYVIRTVIRIGKRKIRTVISLSNRDNMRYPVLIGRRLLKGKFLIDVKRKHTGGLRLEKIINTSQNSDQ